MCDIADEACAVWIDDKRKARKPHRCQACGETIRAGDHYERHVDLYDGHWTTVKRCLRCAAMWEEIAAMVDIREVAVDLRLNCGTEWGDSFGYDPPEHVAALAFWLPGEPLPAAIERRERGSDG